MIKTLTANHNHLCFKELEHLVTDDTTALYTVYCKKPVLTERKQADKKIECKSWL